MLLKNIARALLKHVGNAVGFGMAGNIAVDIWDSWSKEGQDQHQKLAEVQQLAQQSAGETRVLAQAVALEVAGDQPEEVRQSIQTYLTQVPAMVRRSLRRPADPTGTTVPSGLAITKAEDLLTFLPTKPSRFKVGETPPGVGDWELVELLGVGGFGEVWKARNPYFDSVAPVALKFCLDPEASRTLRHEAAVLNQVMKQGKHAGIVQLQHSYLSANPPCLEYEYVQGGDLTGLIHDWHRSGSWSAAQVTGVMLQLAEIVGFAHRLDPPIVHRDLKPANILLQQGQGGGVQLKVADFGIGGVASSQAIKESAKGLPAGIMMTAVATGTYTPLYASPQQTSGRAADPRDDVYALGIIWYQMLTGDLNAGRPGGSRWRQKALKLGMKPELVDLLETCFEDDPNDRPRDATDLTERLKPLLAPVAAPKQATPKQATPTDKPPAVPAGVLLLYLKAKGIVATGYEKEDVFVVLAGSQGVKETVPSIGESLVEKRKALIQRGVLAAGTDCLILKTDCTFESPSMAAGVMLGRSANGRVEWKDQHGTSLKQIQAATDAETPEMAAWNAALANVTNAALVAFYKKALGAGQENYLPKRYLRYRIAGKRRWFIAARRLNAYVWQHDRFDGDIDFWRGGLKQPDQVKAVKDGECLSFSLSTDQDFQFFHQAVTEKLLTATWTDTASDDEPDVEYDGVPVKAEAEKEAAAAATASTGEASHRGKKEGLRKPHRQVLNALAAATGPLSRRAIAAKVGETDKLIEGRIASETLTYADLIEKGYAREKTSNVAGKEERVYEITEAGREALAATQQNETNAPDEFEGGTAAYNAAMSKLGAGQTLTAAEKLSLAGHLPNLARSQLKSLHSALGAGGVHGLKEQIVNKVQSVLTGGGALPSSPPSPAPAPSAPPPTPVATPAATAAPITATPPPPTQVPPVKPTGVPRLPLPQARVLQALLPVAGEPSSLSRTELAQRMNVTSTSGTISVAMGGRSDSPHKGLLDAGLVTEVKGEGNETAYQITTEGIKAIEDYLKEHGELPETRDKTLSTNVRYKKKMTPEWSKRAGLVMASPYWKVDSGENGENRKASDERFDEFMTMQEAVQEADSYDDLSDEMKAIFDRAEVAADAAAKEYEEFVKNDTGGYGRFLGTEI